MWLWHTQHGPLLHTTIILVLLVITYWLVDTICFRNKVVHTYVRNKWLLLVHNTTMCYLYGLTRTQHRMYTAELILNKCVLGCLGNNSPLYSAYNAISCVLIWVTLKPNCKYMYKTVTCKKTLPCCYSRDPIYKV